MRVLVVEDDERVAAAVAAALERQSMTVVRVSLAAEVWTHLVGADVVLLDLGLPDEDGMEVCRRIRAATDVPVIVTTARSEVADRVLGLHSGADDYLVKPYDVRELVARIHAVRRRHGGSARADDAPQRLADGVELDRARHRVLVAGEEVVLTRKEFAILALLATADGAVCSRERIVAEVWGRTWRGADRTLDVHIGTLRTKIGRPALVATVRGVGYRLARDGERD